MQRTNREIIEKVQELIAQHRVREAVETFVSEDYIQHNPTLDDGREGVIGLIESIVGSPGFKSSIKRTIAEGDLVAMHLLIEFSDRPAMAVVDIWRLENGKIVEHWDVIQEVPDQTVSGNSMV